MIRMASFLLSLLVIASILFAGEGLSKDEENVYYALAMNTPQEQSAVSVYAMSLTNYYVGFAYRGPNWTAEVDDISQKTRQYFAEQVTAGKLVGAGRVMDGKDLHWILFFKSDALDAAKMIVASAPAVQAGRFTGEVRQIWGTKGIGDKLTKDATVEGLSSTTKSTYYLVVMTKGSKWNAEENASNKKLIEDHISNVLKLQKAGTVKFHGVFEDQGDIRGFGILQAASLKEAETIFKDDPAVKADWIKPTYYTFEVAEGVLP